MNTSCFDICGTLYFENTTFAFLKYFLNNDRRFFWFDKFRTSLFGRAMFKLCDRICDIDLARKIAVRFLRGIPQATIECAASDFARDKLTSVEQTTALLLAARQRADRIVLISATLEPVAAAIGDQWGVEAHGSRLEYDGKAICTGRIQEDLLNLKGKIVERLRESSETITFYSDNFTDAPVLPLVDSFYAIVHSDRQQRFWESFRTKGIIRVR